MYTNASSTVLLKLETLGLSNRYIYPAFLFGTLTYLFIMFCNLLLLTTIACSAKLHKPMFILLFNLPISDMLGATALFPQLVYSIVTQKRLISLPACVIQALLVHTYGGGNLLTLTAMAYDRYIAICCPLKYNAIMTPHTLVKMIVSIWSISISLIVVQLSLLARLKICRTNVIDLYCNNPSIVKLTCDDTRVNNYYGLFTIFVCQAGPLSVILYTYAHILRICVMTHQSNARKKAIQTCGTHLVIYLVLEFSAFITLIGSRIKIVSPYMRRALGVTILVFPPILDPIIYGLKTKELKTGIKMFFKINVGS
ncbi:putative gustatory receptor clone PTE03 [Sparus aurata]|uniref:putative gustatory receptor clone PTE03 n=1 Tax=Sparus aurata TaxID=8175 RepID=UPI0011C14717|nr:putative gustatory receptor clone PTE03 [Sparus aurata]